MLMEQTTKKPALTSEREQIFKTMHELYHQSRVTIAQHTATLADTRILTGYVMEVRKLLAELEQVEYRARGNDRTLAAIQDLKARYGDLEGMVKEERNSLEQDSFSL